MDATTIPSKFFISKENARMLVQENPNVEVFANLPHTTKGPLTYAEFLATELFVYANFFLKTNDVKACATLDDILHFDDLIENSIRVELKRIGRPVKVNQLDNRLILSSEDNCFVIDTMLIDHEDDLVCYTQDGAGFVWDEGNFVSGTTNEKHELLQYLIEIV